MELTQLLPAFIAGLYLGAFIAVAPILYLIDKWQNTKKEYEELRAIATKEISELRKKLNYYEGGKRYDA